ncbi:hypothetical protein M9H77_27668 [Catharanthus roseus]|uniref:Uncharacterized protein n=1 Tax=Catharanthus roseus TaxID=4058 RepID=A0ACC0AES6_CATRO|nr:hypothetical protein M9H77_27668 [Catharanthus roseus]
MDPTQFHLAIFEIPKSLATYCCCSGAKSPGHCCAGVKLAPSKSLRLYRRLHYDIVKHKNPGANLHEIECMHSDKFADWFNHHVQDLQLNNDDPILKDLKFLSKGPNQIGL